MSTIDEVDSLRTFINNNPDMGGVTRLNVWLELKGAQTKYGVTTKYPYFLTVIDEYNKQYKLGKEERQQKMLELAKYYKQKLCG